MDRRPTSRPRAARLALGVIAGLVGAGLVWLLITSQAGSISRVKSAITERFHAGPAAGQPAKQIPTEAATPTLEAPLSAFSGDAQETRNLLLKWQQQEGQADIHRQVMHLAIAYFSQQAGRDREDLRQRIIFASAGEYARSSASHCSDVLEVNPSTEPWLVQILEDRLYVNDAFSPPARQTATDLFFRYLIGVYNLAPELKTYPTPARSLSGPMASYEKGLLLLERKGPTEGPLKQDCFVFYRQAVQEAFTADAAMRLVEQLSLTISPEYAYPQKNNLQIFRQQVVPLLGGNPDFLMDPFMRTDSGEFYKRLGNALGVSNDVIAAETAADQLLTKVFPSTTT